MNMVQIAIIKVYGNLNNSLPILIVIVLILIGFLYMLILINHLKLNKLLVIVINPNIIGDQRMLHVFLNSLHGNSVLMIVRILAMMATSMRVCVKVLHLIVVLILLGLVST